MARIHADAKGRVQALLDSLVQQGHEVGVQVAAYLDGELVVHAWAGVADTRTGRPVDGSTLFNGFSCSKGVTATLVHLLVDRGDLAYDDPVARHWPEFGVHGKETVTLREVLAHTSGLPQMPAGLKPDDLTDWDGVCRAIADQPLLFRPGSTTAYHAMSYGWILGEVARRVTGRPFAELVRELITGPLGITDSLYFGLPDSEAHRVAWLESGPLPRATRPPSEWLFKAIPPGVNPSPKVNNRPELWRAVLPASGGLMTARALACHYAALVGEVDGVRLFGPERLDRAMAVQVEAEDLALEERIPKALGYFRGGAKPLSGPFTAFGCPGAGGSDGWADPTSGLAVAMLKNRLTWVSPPEGRTADQVAGVLREAIASR